ncbi:hypothetical protein HDV64DRAFT_217757 [Trichoderma sp. TUCIM 5745]
MILYPRSIHVYAMRVGVLWFTLKCTPSCTDAKETKRKREPRRGRSRWASIHRSRKDRKQPLVVLRPSGRLVGTCSAEATGCVRSKLPSADKSLLQTDSAIPLRPSLPPARDAQNDIMAALRGPRLGRQWPPYNVYCGIAAAIIKLKPVQYQPAGDMLPSSLHVREFCHAHIIASTASSIRHLRAPRNRAPAKHGNYGDATSSMAILLLPAPWIYNFRRGSENGNKEHSMEGKARMGDTRARLAYCEIYRLVDPGGACLSRSLHLPSTCTRSE